MNNLFALTVIYFFWKDQIKIKNIKFEMFIA
jgi:hypothetical protein